MTYQRTVRVITGQGGWRFQTRPPLPSLRYQLRLNHMNRIKNDRVLMRAVQAGRK